MQAWPFFIQNMIGIRREKARISLMFQFSRLVGRVIVYVERAAERVMISAKKTNERLVGIQIMGTTWRPGVNMVFVVSME